jgi:hypothetical protein
MESSSVGLRAMVGRALGLLGVVCAIVGIFVVEGISIEYVGIILGGIRSDALRRAPSVVRVATAVVGAGGTPPASGRRTPACVHQGRRARSSG